MTDIAEFFYGRWAQEYSKFNWVKHWPLWSELTEESKKWWIDFVAEIQSKKKQHPEKQ